MKKVLDICPFMGLRWIDENEVEHFKGEGLTSKENERLDNYFAKFYKQRFSRDKAIELAQLALDNIPIPKDWRPN